MSTAQNIVNEARTWLGVPFVHQGRSRAGVDCIGLAVCVLDAVAPSPAISAEVANYRRRPTDGLLLEKVRKHCEQIPEALPGSLVLIQWPNDKTPSHVMICTGETIIHSYKRAAKVYEAGYRAQWVRWTHSIYKLPGVTYP